MPHRSDTDANTTQEYKARVRSYLRQHGEVASKQALRDHTNVPNWYIDQLATSNTFYTSLTHNGRNVASKHIIGRRADHQGFWRPECDDITPVFHRQESTAPTLKHLVFRRPSGLTAAEATELLGRRCYRALESLAEQGDIVAAEVGDTTVYLHTWERIREKQLTERRTDVEIELDSQLDPADDAYLYREEILAVFLSVATAEIDSIPPERAAALVLRQFEGDAFTALERRLHRNQSLRDALEYTTRAEVPDGTTLWRAFDALEPTDLRDCLQAMCGELLAEEEHGGKYAIVDGTHVEAWANTRQEIEDGAVEGASWGKHEGSFYGYKVYLVVDAATELPVAITTATGSRNDVAAFVPLIEEFEARYDVDDLEVVFGDAGFDSQANREACQDRVGASLQTAINPRRSAPLKALKDEIKVVFEEHGDEIETAYDVLELLPQQLLSDYGVEVGNLEESYIYRAIKERLNRHLRSGVERVISRLKGFNGLDALRTRKRENVETHLVLSVVALVAAAFTAHRHDKPSLKHSLSRII
ncbi:MAG: transposase [Halodesulfurarchaeum sp.]